VSHSPLLNAKVSHAKKMSNELWETLCMPGWSRSVALAFTPKLSNEMSVTRTLQYQGPLHINGFRALEGSGKSSELFLLPFVQFHNNLSAGTAPFPSLGDLWKGSLSPMNEPLPLVYCRTTRNKLKGKRLKERRTVRCRRMRCECLCSGYLPPPPGGSHMCGNDWT